MGQRRFLRFRHKDVGFKGVGACPKISRQVLWILIFCDFGRRDGLADLDGKALAVLVGQLAGKAGGAKHGMDLVDEIEPTRVTALPIQWDNGYVGVLNDAGDGNTPRQVFWVVVAVIARHFPCWKHAQSIARRNVLDGTLDTAHTTFPFGVFLEGIDGKESLLEVRDVRKDEVGHQLEVGSHLGDEAVEHHALDAAEGMVADHHKAAFLGNVGQLRLIHIESDIHVLQQMVGELTTLIISGSVE